MGGDDDNEDNVNYTWQTHISAVGGSGSPGSHRDSSMGGRNSPSKKVYCRNTMELISFSVVTIAAKM
jgi:hypothetical protein